MTSSRKPSMGSTYASEKRVSQWEELMRKFSEAHKDQCKYASLEIPRFERSTKNLPTGSKYSGSWDILGMSGYGEYTFPNGVIYEGDFEEGMFHGEGKLRYNDGISIRGKWVNGKIVERTLLFGDTLEYSENNWKYCEMPDRRFAIEYETGLKPAGKSYLTADQPTKEVPPGYYDTGDGFYDPKTKCIYRHDDISTMVRFPSVREQEWIIENCRKRCQEPIGPCQGLYEKFSQPVVKPQPPPSPAAGDKSKCSDRGHTVFRIQSVLDEDFESSPEPCMFYDASQELETKENCFEKQLFNTNLCDTASVLQSIDLPDDTRAEDANSELTCDKP